jgi:hypothetical protein
MQIGIRWLIPPYVHKRFLRNGFLLRKPNKEKGLVFSSGNRKTNPNF